MQQIITIYDYLLLPFYLIMFYLIVKRKAKKYNGTPLRKFFLLAFWLHMFGAIFLAMLMQYYYGYSDSFGYYIGGDIFKGMIIKDLPSFRYFFYSGNDLVSEVKALGYGDKMPLMMSGDPNVFIMKISAMLSFFCFNKYLIISLFFGFFSFIGSWKLFYVMQKINGGRHIQLLGYSTIATPSLWLWGSGLFKEPICIGALGVSIFIIYKFFIIKHFSFKNLLLLLLLIYVVTSVKSYITAIFIASVSFILLIRLFFTIKNLALRIGTIFIFLFIMIILLVSINIGTYLEEIAYSSYSQIESRKNSYEIVQAEDENSKAGFSVGDLEPNLSSLLLKSPEVIASCLFRPFIWESRKVIILFAALETFVVLLATLFIFLKTKILGFFYFSFNNPYRLFCFIFSILFALLIGFTTFNFGAMIRYKIIFLPFYFFLLINIYTIANSKKESLRYGPKPIKYAV